MKERDAFLVEFDHEMAVTRRVLERVPDDAFEWPPHEKSFTLGGLATHLAQLPHWGRQILTTSPTISWAPRANRAPKASRAEVLDTFDRHVREVRRALVAGSDAELAAPWTLKRGTHVVLSMPRIAALRGFSSTTSSTTAAR